MFYIVFAVILLLVAVGFFIASAVHQQDRRDQLTRFGKAVVGALVVGVLFLFTAFMSFTTIDARAVGIQTSFGKYADTLNSGAQFVAPWSSVEEFTTRLQPADLDGDEAVPVTFKGGGSGKINSNFQWAISAEDGVNGAQALWEKYKDFDAVKAFVLRAGRDAIINVANDYPPNEARTKQDEIGLKVHATLGATLKKYGIVLDSVSILGMPLDEKSQASLDKLVAAEADEARAAIQKRTATTEAETAKLREQQGALTPQALTMKCLEIVNAWDTAKNGPLPATFNCGLGNAQAGVLVGAK